MYILRIDLPKIRFVYEDIVNLNFSYSKTLNGLLIRGLFGKEAINVSSNMKRGVYLGTHFLSNECLYLGTEGVIWL